MKTHQFTFPLPELVSTCEASFKAAKDALKVGAIGDNYIGVLVPWVPCKMSESVQE